MPRSFCIQQTLAINVQRLTINDANYNISRTHFGKTKQTNGPFVLSQIAALQTMRRYILYSIKLLKSSN